MPTAIARLMMFAFLGLWAASPACAQAVATISPETASSIDEAAVGVRSAYMRQLRSTDWPQLPIGVFDSGTGGLGVLETVLKLDVADNATKRVAAHGDGIPDFCHERFVFLADQANMPYGNYPAVGRKGLLLSLVRNDALFLLGTEYYASAEAQLPRGSKRPVKAILIACNTATAYGKEDIEKLIARAGLDIAVVGVVDAGARGAVRTIKSQGGGVIGVLATEGTVSARAYPAAISRVAAQLVAAESSAVVQQGSLGLASAIDGVRSFIAPRSASDDPRPDYRGPSLSEAHARIDRRLLPRYNFDFSHHRMLFAGDRGNPTELQINSVDNYVRYDVVCLMENVRRQTQPVPLKALILGCTHFPYCKDTIAAELKRLFDYQEQGHYVYRQHMIANVAIIDPAPLAGEELYCDLARQQRIAGDDEPDNRSKAEFYITVPYRGQRSKNLDADGSFTYEYKYGRNEASLKSDVRTVPLTPQYLDPHVAQRLRHDIPNVWRMLGKFEADGGKDGQLDAGKNKDKE